jgi:hypothetical protein
MTIWQTTNQEPWVSALVDGAIKFKTRTQRPCVTVGTPVILHASTRWWPALNEFRNEIMGAYVDCLNELRPNLGKALGIGIISQVGPTDECVDWNDLEPWDVTWGNCAAEYMWACDPVLKFKQPFKIRGFQAPFARAKADTITLMHELNPEVAEFLEGIK